MADDSLALRAVMDSTWNPRASAIVVKASSALPAAMLGPGEATATPYGVNALDPKATAPPGRLLANR